MNMRNMIKQYIDVDSVLKNEDFTRWYERLRKTGFLFLLFNLTYLFGFMLYRVLADFTVSSFLFGYFMQYICNLTGYVKDIFIYNESNIRFFVEKQFGVWTGTVKLTVSYINDFLNGRNEENSSAPVSAPVSAPTTQSDDSENVRNSPVTISLSANSMCIKEKPDDCINNVALDDETDNTSATNIILNTQPVDIKATTIQLDASVIDFLLKRNQAQDALMKNVMKLSDSIIDTDRSSNVSPDVSTNVSPNIPSLSPISSELHSQVDDHSDLFEMDDSIGEHDADDEVESEYELHSSSDSEIDSHSGSESPRKS